jgi:hypothetical protein
MSAIEKVERQFCRWLGPLSEARADISRKDFRAALTEAWAKGYAASDYEAYHLGTHGRTDNPYEES